LRWHGALDGTVDVRRFDIGQTGWDRPGGFEHADSIVFNRNGPRNAFANRSPVSAPAGTTLYFLDAIHPWMQGRIRVR
jgi:hypothetical protein